MSINKIIKLIYILYTIYILIILDITTLTIIQIIPGIILLWISYFAFNCGYLTIKSKITINKNHKMILDNNKIKFIIMVSVITSAILVIKFYTGQTPITVINNLATNKSVYYEYQKFFAQQQLHIFSFNKLPYILMMFYIKLILIYSYITLLIVKNKINRIEKFYIFIVTLAHLYIGIGRGTNFEFFELFLLTTYVILNRTKQRFIINKQIVKIFLLGLVMIAIFNTAINARGVELGKKITNDIFYDPQSLFNILLPNISRIPIIIFDYFGFGFYYIGSYFNQIVFSSLKYSLAILFPFGTILIDETNRSQKMLNLIDMGSRWHPDFANAIDNFGILGLIVLIFLLGLLVKKINNKYSGTFICHMLNYLVTLQMFSFPTGNFILVSSSNKLLVVFCIFYLLFKKINL